MLDLITLIDENENWLVKRILGYALARGYTEYTSTVEEAWRLSIVGLSASLLAGLRQFEDIPEFGPHDDFQSDPMTHFGVIEA